MAGSISPPEPASPAGWPPEPTDAPPVPMDNPLPPTLALAPAALLAPPVPSVGLPVGKSGWGLRAQPATHAKHANQRQCRENEPIQSWFSKNSAVTLGK